MQKGGGKNNTTPLLRTVRGLGRRSRPAGGGRGRGVEGDRQREEGTPVQEKPENDRELGAG